MILKRHKENRATIIVRESKKEDEYLIQVKS